MTQPSPLDDPDNGSFPLRSFLEFQLAKPEPGRCIASTVVTDAHPNPMSVLPTATSAPPSRSRSASSAPVTDDELRVEATSSARATESCTSKSEPTTPTEN